MAPKGQEGGRKSARLALYGGRKIRASERILKTKSAVRPRKVEM